jgi:hypothetical protein
VAIAGKLSPEEAAQKLFSQQGIKQGQSVDVHGAKVANAFQAQTQQGEIEGIAAFIPHQSMTYALIGYGGQGAQQTYGNTFTDSMGSFGELKDHVVAQPARIKIVPPDSPMSLADFESKYPSTVKSDRVALINGVEAGGQIRAGLAKQVVGGPPEQK